MTLRADSKPLRSILEKVGQEVFRLNRLVTDLLGFARSPQPIGRAVDLAAAAREARELSHVPVEIESDGSA